MWKIKIWHLSKVIFSCSKCTCSSYRLKEQTKLKLKTWNKKLSSLLNNFIIKVFAAHMTLTIKYKMCFKLGSFSSSEKCYSLKILN